MALDGGDIVLPIKLSTEEAEQLWQQLKDRIEKNPPKPGYAPPPPAVEQGTKSLIQRLQEYRAEQTQSNRAARFFANELVSVIPGMSTANAGLRGLTSLLIEGAAGGIGFGLALEGVKLAVTLATDAMEAQAREMEKVRTIRLALAVAYSEGADRVAASLKTETEAAKAYREEMEKHRPVLKQVADALGEERKSNGPTLADYLRGSWGDAEGKGQGGTVENAWAIWRKRISDLEAQYDKGEKAARRFADTQADIATRWKDAGAAPSSPETAGEKTTAAFLGEQASQFAARRRDLSRDAALAAADERQKVQLQLQFQIEDLRKFAVSDREQRTAISLARRIAAAKELAMQRADWEAQKALFDQFQAKQYDSAMADAKANMERFRAFQALRGELDPNVAAAEKFRAEMALLDEVAAKYGAVGDTLAQVEIAKTQLVLRESQRRIAAWKEESAEGLAGATALQMTADMIGGQFAKMAMHAGAYDRAMQAAGKSQAATMSELEGAALKWTQEVLAAIAQQAAVKAIFALAEGYFLASNPLTAAYAPVAFQAAATYGVVAGAAAAAGYAIGEYRPMTQEERGQVEGGTSSAAGSSGGGSSSGASSSGTRIGWRDAGVDMGTSRQAASGGTTIVYAMDAQSFEQFYRRQGATVLKVQREMSGAGRRA